METAVSSNVTNTSTLQPGHSSSRHPTQRNERTCPQKEMYKNVRGSFIHNCQKWKQPKCSSIGEQINKHWDISTIKYYSEIFKGIMTNVNESQKHYSKPQNPYSKISSTQKSQKTNNSDRDQNYLWEVRTVMNWEGA